MRFPTGWRRSVRAASPGLLLATLACAQRWLEQSMPLHMGVELPALFLVGWIAAWCGGDRTTGVTNAWNGRGLPGLLFALCATSFWMLPVALDLAVLSPAVAVAKVASMVAAGFVARVSWGQAGMVIQSFFVLNWFWMTVAGGLLYQDAPQQLCSVYLADQQAEAGKALVAWAAAGLVAWMWQVGADVVRTESEHGRAHTQRFERAGLAADMPGSKRL